MNTESGIRHPRLRVVSLVVTLCVFWVLMSGYFTPFLLAAGLGSALVVAWLASRMEVADREGHPAHLKAHVILGYWVWLAREIWTSGMLVSRIIMHPRLPVSPTLVRFRPTQETALGLATHANSITLTPGTITVEAGHHEFLVHGVTRETAAGAVDSEMDRRVRRFEGND